MKVNSLMSYRHSSIHPRLGKCFLQLPITATISPLLEMVYYDPHEGIILGIEVFNMYTQILQDGKYVNLITQGLLSYFTNITVSITTPSPKLLL